MDYNLPENLDACYVFVSEAKKLLYYSHIPTAILTLLIGVFVMLRSKFALVGKLLFAISFSFFLWVAIDLLVWLNYDKNTLVIFSWSFFGVLYVLIYAFSFYFFNVFIDKKDISFTKKAILFLLIAPVIILTPTTYNMENFNLLECGATEGMYFTNYYYLVGLALFLWIIVLAFLKYKKETDRNQKKQILFLSLGIGFFLASFFLSGFLVSYLVDKEYIVGGDYNMEQYGLFGMPVFMAFLAYLIVRYNAFNVKLVAAQALVVAIIILIGSQFAFIRSETNRLLTGLTLILSSIGGYFLIVSIKKEIKRKEMLQEISNRLSVANDKLRQMDNTKTEFISIASHQLRTPLTSIKGYASLILEGSYGEMENRGLRSAVNNIFTSTERLISLVDDLLDVSRIEAGRMQFNYASLQIEDVCREVIKVFSIQAGNKKLDLRLELPKQKLPAVVTDRKRLTEVISNLVDNALKYTDEGSVCVKARLKEDKMRIEISDTGIGIPKSEIPYLFVKFSRGKDVGRLSASGTGLGLHFVKKVTEAMGGRVWIESEGSGKGTTFIVEIPLVAKEK